MLPMTMTPICHSGPLSLWWVRTETTNNNNDVATLVQPFLHDIGCVEDTEKWTSGCL